jgi:D-beta-D-heptose 7-phosphate kinase/D-beta-D-heptose 1-phosphate adenosyltransferase
MTPFLPPFSRAHVLVVGDVMLDRYLRGSTTRISPEAPVPVVRVEDSSDRPGGAGNVAVNIAALGASARLIGCCGNDEAGTALDIALCAAGVDSQLTVHPGVTTITKMRVLSRQQQLLRLDFEPRSVPALEQLPDLKGWQVLVLSDYGKGLLSSPQALIQAGREAGIPVLVDPKGTGFMRYRGATLLTPNLAEFEAEVGLCRSEQEIAKRGARLIDLLGLAGLLITRGEHGMTLLQPDEAPLHLPTQAREVYDVTGAGDTVIATLAAALAAGSSLTDAVALANLAAGIVVGKLGTATVNLPELRASLKWHDHAERGVVSQEQLATAVATARAQGERIVFTNGCFDILHAGHVAYLEQAASLGERLIVAVNSDASVRRLKGAGRPINPLHRRMAVLAGLSSVDWVVDFSEDTPELLLQAIRPDVLVKGGDYGPDQVVGRDIVESYGGAVQVLSKVGGASTTALVEQLRSEAN